MTDVMGNGAVVDKVLLEREGVGADDQAPAAVAAML